LKIGDFWFAIEFKENPKVRPAYGTIEFCPPEHLISKLSDPRK
jgi:serine/threonine protein kinase